MWWDNDDALKYLLAWRPGEAEFEVVEGETIEEDPIEDGLPDVYYRRFVYSHWRDHSV